MLATDTLLQDRYLVLGLIAQGGMGAVYQAKDRRLGNTVALKETFFSDEQLRRAFEREARLLAGLRHAALPVVSDHFVEDEGQFLVMQYIPGDDLATLLTNRGGPFGVEETLRWADVLLDALSYLHGQDPPVVHRDIKPQNLKLTERGEVILLDFGLAKGSPQLMSQVSGTGSILGYTPHYAPLEQIQGSGTDPRSDLYSLAATIYHLITGVVPADALTRASATVCGQPDPLQPANTVNPDVPAEVSDVLMMAMDQNRERRPAGATEMRSLVEAAIKRDARSTRFLRSETDTSGDQFSAETKVQFAAPVTQADSADDQPTIVAQAPSATAGVQTRGRPLIWIGIAAIALMGVLLALGFGAWNRSPEPAVEVASTPGPTGAGEPIPSLRAIGFEIRMVDETGKVIERRMGEARTFAEDLAEGVTLEMVEVHGGSFTMGSPADEAGRTDNEGPQHQVTVPKFYMGRYEVTQAQWRAVAGLPRVNIDLDSDPSKFKGDDRPVENISWDEAMEFCARLSQKTGRKYRLPTEAEWEYACRARTKSPFHFGPTISTDLVNFDGDFPYAAAPKGVDRQETLPVGRLGMANAFGLLNMHGNVREWCLDAWYDDHRGAPVDGRAREPHDDDPDRVLRGGTWFGSASTCRSGARVWAPPEVKSPVNGLRVVVGSM